MTDESVFAAALAIPDPKERAAYLDRACPDPATRREVEALLAAHAASSPLDCPPGDLARTGAYAANALDANAPGSPAVGDRVGPYRLMEQIGEGGFGLVFVAEQSEPVRRKVALKVLKPGMDTRDVVARFEAERQALALMDHPNIAHVLDAGSTPQGRPYFVMELVRGVPITEFCDVHKLPPKDRLNLFVQVCQAVQHAHQKGVIHRDIKPSNVLVTVVDGRPVPKVIDFGVAKAVGQSLTDKTVYTRFAQMIGTPLYMSPEQAELSGVDVDTRSDVYALGVLLYELLTGSTPFDRQRFSKAAYDEIRRIIREEEPPRPSTRLTSLGQTLTAVSASRGTDPGKLAGLVRGELDWIVMRCLEKDRNRRYDSAAGLAKDVQRHLAGDAVEACPPTLGYRLRKVYRRNRAAVLVGGTVAAILLVAVAVSLGFGIQARRAEAAANANALLASESAAIADARLTELTAKTDDLNRTTELQVLTRYAAEMNLVQAAYDGKNMAEVKRLLLAQVPRGKETDLRGPEWHYWWRKLNGQTSERRIEYTRGLEGPMNKYFASSAVAISPDGKRVATSAWVLDGLAPVRHILRVFDTDSGRQLHETTLDEQRLGLTNGQGSGGEVNHPRLTFSPDGGRVLIEVTLPDKDQLRPYFFRSVYLHWDLASGTVRPSDFRRTKPRDVEEARNQRVSASVSDDLAWVCETATSEARTTIRICRFDDPASEFTYAGPPDTRAVLSPDGRHVMRIQWGPLPASSSPDAGPQARTATLAYYRVGDEQPVWTRNLDLTLSPAMRERDLLRGHSWFGPRGDRFHILTVRDRYFVRRTIDPATGDPPAGEPAEVRLFPEGHESLDHIVWISRLAQPDATGARLALPGQFGLEVAGVRPPRTDGPGRDYSGTVRVESIDGPPINCRFRPDGTLVTVHLDDRFLVVRRWPDPASLVDGAHWASLVGAEPSPDGTKFAVAVYGPPSPGGARPIKRPNIERVAVFSDRGERLLDVDCTGEATAAHSLFRRSDGWRGRFNPYVLSADGRRLLLLQTVRPAGAAAYDRLVAWDLDTRQLRTLDRLDPGQEYREAYLFAGEDRVLLNVAERQDPAAQVIGMLSLSAARVIDLTTGQPVCEMALPPAEKIARIAATDGGFVGYEVGPGGPPFRYHRWNAGGAYLGLEKELPVDPAAGPVVVQQSELTRGSRFVRATLVLDSPEGNRTTGRVEVWDTGRRGAGDRPLFTLESENSGTGAFLSPNGRRLIVYLPPGNGGYFYNRDAFEMYDTTTGRLLLRLPNVGPQSGSTWGIWSADGTAFWRRMTPDGKFSGYDFRPVKPEELPPLPEVRP